MPYWGLKPSEEFITDMIRHPHALRFAVLIGGSLLFLVMPVARAAPLGPWISAPSKPLQSLLRRYGTAWRPTAIMVIEDGKVSASWGDVSAKVNVRSVRKSLLSALYGIQVRDHRIDLAETLSHLSIDDVSPVLTEAERSASIRDLLMARSGVYHRAAYETEGMQRKRPQQGSHAPGTAWYYNNWDFNVLGTIYQRKTGEDIFRSFENRIARPIGMEDFSSRDGRYVYAAVSRHPAYTFSMSARDLARFGLLFLDGGQWNGREVVPEDWISESTRAYSLTDRRGFGYGYLWWTLPSETYGPGAFMASGSGGQSVIVVPSKRLVIVQTVDRASRPDGIRTVELLSLLKSISDAQPDR